MEIPIVQIGNSKGIRLAKTILVHYNINDRVELIFKEGFLILRPAGKPRVGWEAAFADMHARKEDALLIDDLFVG